ncbi:hypothetical protein Q8F55_008637 [Vanrija albida]|uniref:Uncharacterized protein n=1 Tax=Vanrija albida TaxID=181172 RepID=A0ABR3PRD3_9TREE
MSAELVPEADGMDVDHPLLDRALDDIPARRGPDEPVPEHVTQLMGRMAKNKIYLAEESPAIIHHDGQERLRRDPRLARLVDELDRQDPTPWLDAISETAVSPIRHNALYVSSELIKHLSTAKVFTWASEYGAAPMGIEWLNDSTLVLLFHTPAAALLGLSALSKAGFDPTEGDDPLLERAAFQFPTSLLPRAEAPKPKELDYEGGETLNYGDDDDAPKEPAAETDPDAPVKRGRGGFSAGREPAGTAHGRFDLAPLAKPAAVEFAEGVDPHARVTVRYATTADAKQRKEAGQSEWYKRHGRGAGKEVASSRRGYGRDEYERGGRLSDRIGTAGEGRDFARRIGRERERERPYDRPARRGRAREDDLDAELERMAASRAAGEDAYERRDERERRGGGREREERGERGPRPERRPRARQDDLDRELDDLFAARSSA